MEDPSNHASGERTLHELIPLMNECKKGIDWDEVRARCLSHPEEAARLYEDERGEIDPSDCPTVLHAMMLHSPTKNAVSAVLNAYPEAIGKRAYIDDDFLTPLDLGIEGYAPGWLNYGFDATIGDILLQGYFEERQRRGSPLGFRMERNCTFDEVIPWEGVHADKEKVRAMLEICPLKELTIHMGTIELSSYSNMGRTLIEKFFYFFFCPERKEWTQQKKDETWDIMQLVLGFVTHRTAEQSVLDDRPHCYLQGFLVFAKTTPSSDEDEIMGFLDETRSREPSQFSLKLSRRLPLHELIVSNNKYFNSLEYSEGRFGASFVSPTFGRIVSTLLGEYPEAARTPDLLTEDLPLHAVLRLGLPFEELLEAEPRALRTRSGVDHSYPFEAAMLRWGHISRDTSWVGRGQHAASLSTAYVILREEPSLLAVRPLLAVNDRPRARRASRTASDADPAPLEGRKRCRQF